MGKKKNKKKDKEIAETEDRKELKDNKYHWRSVEDIYYRCNIDFKYYSREEVRYVSDVIGKDDIVKWESDSPVFISAQTGSGKNFFIKEILIRLVNESNSNWQKNKILLISNRLALTRQSKLDLAKALVEITGDNALYEMLENYTDQGIDKFCIDLGIITVCSYQQLYVKRLKETMYNDQTQQYKYIICDECHFFTGDALFNPCTDEILSAIVRNYQNAVRIYMSATLEDAFLPIIEKEYEASEYNSINCIYYYFERNYDYIEKIYVYKEMEQLVSRIKEDDKSKWLIFVSSRSKGGSLRENLQKSGIKVSFLTSESKEMKTYKDIVEKEKFEEQVLISTAVLDNGINIKDSQLKNVVIDVLDRTEFLQMLGRVRIEEKMKINLYIRDYTKEEVEKLLVTDVEAMIARLTSDFEIEGGNIFYNMYSDPRYKVNELFYIKDVQKLLEDKISILEENILLPMDIFEELKQFISTFKYFDYNHCAIYKLIERISIFMEILKAEGSEYFLPTGILNKREAVRTRIYNTYKEGKNKRNILIQEYIYHVLESENNYRHRVKDEEYVRGFSFRNYFLLIMIEKLIEETENLINEYARHTQQIQQENYKSYNSDYDDDFDNSYEEYNSKTISAENKLKHLNQQKKYQEEFLVLYDSEVPILTEQAHWIEKALNKASDFEYLEEVKEEEQITEKEVEEFLKKYAVRRDDYPDELKKNQKGWSFSLIKILNERGCLVNKLKENEIYQKVLNWFYEKYGLDSPEGLIEYFEKTPYTIGNNQYKLMKVRGTKTGDQKVRYLFLEFDKS